MKKVFMAAWLALAALFVAIPVQAVPARWIPTNTINVLDQSATYSAATNTTSETTLATVNIPGAALGPDGMLRVTISLSMTSSANLKSVNVKYGGSVFNATNYGASVGSVQFTAILRARGNSTQSGFGVGNAVTSPGGLYALAVNSMLDQALTVTCAMAALAETCAIEGYTVEVIRP